MNLVFEAMAFAQQKHANQVRKYTLEPYWKHLAEVAGIAAAVGHLPSDVPRGVMLATAWLHDVVEDQGVEPEELEQRFGILVRQGVMLLSDLETGTRAERKAASRERLAGAPGWVQAIKVADVISNASSIEVQDPDFAVWYLDEKRRMLERLERAPKSGAIREGLMLTRGRRAGWWR